jgi:hypothetical protein
MAGNVNTAPRLFARTATKFSRLLVKLRPTKQDPADYGDYAGSPMAVIQLPPGQTADALQIQDYTGAVLYSIGANGRSVLTAKQTTIVDSAATSLVDVAIPASAQVGGFIHYVVRAFDGTDFQALAGMVSYSAVNKAASITLAITEVAGNQAKAVSSGTLTLAWTFVAGANKGTIKVQPTGSLTETAPYDITFTITPILGAATIL